MLSQYQASYPAILDIATSLSLTKLFGGLVPTGVLCSLLEFDPSKTEAHDRTVCQCGKEKTHHGQANREGSRRDGR
jgi:hypothetical protein